MTDPLDFLPQPPWKGPPLPRSLNISWYLISIPDMDMRELHEVIRDMAEIAQKSLRRRARMTEILMSLGEILRAYRSDTRIGYYTETLKKTAEVRIRIFKMSGWFPMSRDISTKMDDLYSTGLAGRWVEFGRELTGLMDWIVQWIHAAEAPASEALGITRVAEEELARKISYLLSRRQKRGEQPATQAGRQEELEGELKKLREELARIRALIQSSLGGK